MAAARRGTRRNMIIGAAVALPLLLAAVLLITAASNGPGKPVSTGIPDVAPANSDTLVVAPYGGQWWDRVTALTDPDTGLHTMDPAKSGLSIENVGYSRSPDTVQREIPFTGPLRLFYLESATEAEAAKAAKWISNADGFHGRVKQLGDIVVVSSGWVSDYSAPVKVMSNVEGYKAGVTTEQATMWMDVDRGIETLAGNSEEDTRKAYTSLMRHGFGFTEGTTWIGHSGDGRSWNGDFVAGGVQESQIDFDGTEKAVLDTQEELAATDTGRAQIRVLEPGLGSILSIASFATGEHGTLGVPVQADFPSVENPLVTVVHDVTDWNYAVTGTYSSRENVDTRGISANEEEMTVSYVYADTP